MTTYTPASATCTATAAALPLINEQRPLSTLANRAKMTVASAPGTGAITLGSASVGFQSFASAGILNAALVTYCIEDGSNWEVGQGIYGSSGTTLSRTTVLASNNSNSAINATSAAIVYVVAATTDYGFAKGEPSGRLTLTSATPVQNTGNITGAATIYLTPYSGNRAPFWNGSNWVWSDFSELSQALSDATKSPAAAAASSLYDIFLWNDNGTKRISRGPPWATGGGSATTRGTGPGSTTINQLDGFWVNSYAITNGPNAGYGLYMGSIYTNASSTVDYVYGVAGSGGGVANLGVWNYFNRIATCAYNEDSGASYTYSSAVVRAARASANNRITFISGIAEEGFMSVYHFNWRSAAVLGCLGLMGVGIDTTTSFTYGYMEIEAQAALAYYTFGESISPFAPQQGQHYISAVEYDSGSGSTYNQSSGNLLYLVIEN